MIHLLPGYALDRHVLERLDLPPNRFRCADFIPLEKNDTLVRYSLRMAESIGFKSSDVIGGVSTGGMMALEIARHYGAREIRLIASCTHPHSIRWGFRAISPLALISPDWLIRKVLGNVPTVLRYFGMHNAAGETFLKKVMGNFPPELMRKLPRMIMEWPGCEPTVPCYALHSEADWLVQPPRHLPGLTLIPGKSHLLTMTAPQVAKQFLLAAESSQ